MTTSDDAYEWVTVAEACERLGVSPSTVQRMIRDGSLVGEKQQKSQRDRRPQYVVRFPRPQAASDDAIPASDHPEAPQSASDAVTLALVAEMAAMRVAAQETSARLVVVERENATLLAERAALADALKIASDRATEAEAALRARRWYDPRTW